jgi:hypothetical protein
MHRATERHGSATARRRRRRQEGSLNAYLDKCLDIISCMDEFVIYHVPREENPKANALARQAYGHNV